MIPWDEYESQYSDLFKSEKYDCSDRELVGQITENPYLQYFIGLSHFQYDPPFDPSLMYRRNWTSAQRWNLASAGDGKYYLIPKCATNMALDMYGGLITNGTNIL